MAPEVKPTKEGKMPQGEYGEFTPTCLSLYKQYPTGASPLDPLGLFREEDIEGPAAKTK
jgi:hypothetical protein